MSATRIPPRRRARPPSRIDRRPPAPPPAPPQSDQTPSEWREWTLVGIGLVALIAIIAIVFSLVAIAQSDTGSRVAATTTTVTAPAAATNPAFAKAPTLADAHGMPYEKFRPVDPTLPAVPPGAVKKFTVSVMEHITQVDPTLAPVQAWTYTVNGVAYRGTAASPPMVVNQGDKVQITFRNGGAKELGVDMAHSIDIHAAHLPPNKYYVDIAPGKSETFSFVAQDAGVFMYHCATQPILMHTGSGMTGMFVVKPRNLPPVAKELWLTQQEFYIGQPGAISDLAKLTAENPDVIGFNGYANQYKFAPIGVPVNQPIRIYLLDAGPSKWSAFHVIGTLFDTTDIEGTIGHGSQTVNLAPSQGGWVQFTLDAPGNYPFLTHDFGSMVKGAAGILHTTGAPAPKGVPTPPSGGSTAPVLPSMVHTTAPSMPSTPAMKADVNVTMGDIWMKSNIVSFKAGTVMFGIANQGQMPHQFAIVRTPVKTDSSGTPLASTVLAESKLLSPGEHDMVMLRLRPGNYMLVCMMPGHYAAGQHAAFTVTG